MKKSNIFILIITTLFISCTNPKQENIDFSSIQIEGVSLNKNKHWKANIETTKGVQKMLNSMHTFSKTEDVKAYHQLKKQLETQFTDIFTNCTMKGEAHNQLHNYLKPMIGYFEGLEAKNLKTCKENFKALHTHLQGYANYFE